MFCSKFLNLGTSGLHPVFCLKCRIIYFLNVGNEATISGLLLNFSIETEIPFFRTCLLLERIQWTLEIFIVNFFNSWESLGL